MISVILAAIEDDDDKTYMMNLYQDYYALVRSAVYKVMSCENDIDDLVEDTFVKLIEKISLLRKFDCCKTAAYVVYTAKSVAINFIKHRDVQKKHTFYGENADMSNELMISEDTLEESYFHRKTIYFIACRNISRQISIRPVDRQLFTARSGRVVFNLERSVFRLNVDQEIHHFNP